MTTDQTQNLPSILLRQFNHSLKLLSQSIENLDDDQWFQIFFQDDDNYWVYAFTVYHILETTDFYTRSSPDGMEWGARGQIDWNSSQPLDQKIQNLSKSFMKTYLVEIGEKLSHIFIEITPPQLYNSDNFPWFPTVLDKYLYLLRHNMMHIGELNRALRELHRPRIKWE